MTIAVLCAAGAGSVGGGLTALRMSPESSITQPIAPSIDGAATVHPVPVNQSAGAPSRALPDPHAVVVAQIQAALGRVAGWTRAHPGAPCPDASALGATELDPWGHAIELTCTDQPADQIVGAISAGPDGVSGTNDDVKSWHLGHSVTQLVRGPRWTSKSSVTKSSTTKRRRDASSTGDRVPSIPRTASAKPAGAPHSEPASPPAAAPSAQPASAPSSTVPRPSIPPSAPDPGDGIPTRR